MLDFGKLNFSVSFNPTSAFPLDARSVFDSLESAQAAAQNAVEVGSSNGTYYHGQILIVVTDSDSKVYQIQPDNTLKELGTGSGGGGTGGYIIGEGLHLDEGTNTLSVEIADTVEEDNPNPVSSGAVYTVVGNVNELLEEI